MSKEKLIRVEQKAVNKILRMWHTNNKDRISIKERRRLRRKIENAILEVRKTQNKLIKILSKLP